MRAFIGNDKSDIFDHIDIETPLPKQSTHHVVPEKTRDARRGFFRIRRKDLWSIPIEILREVVINALVHTDYSQRGTPMRIAFFDDRIEVENPGFCCRDITVEDMKQGVSKIRNPIISRVFRELNLIEQWGSGFPVFSGSRETLGNTPWRLLK